MWMLIRLKWCAIVVMLVPVIGAAKEVCMLVKSADIAAPTTGKPGYESFLLKANAGHVLKAGQGTIFVYRLYNQEGGVDSGEFTKITVPLGEIVSMSQKKTKPVVVNKGSFVQGGSFIYKGNYWKGGPVRSVLRFNQDGSVSGKIRVIARYQSRVFPRQPKVIKMNFECPVITASVSDLTPWTGAKSENPFDSFSPK